MKSSHRTRTKSALNFLQRGFSNVTSQIGQDGINPCRWVRLPLIILLLSIAGAAQSRPVNLIDRIPFMPYPKTLVVNGGMIPFPVSISVKGLDRQNPAQQGTIATMEELFSVLPGVKCDFGGTSGYRVQFKKSSQITNAEGYELTSETNGIIVLYATEAGQFYGAQTVYQLLAYSWHGTEFLGFSETPAEADAAAKHFVPLLSVKDEPAYQTRSLMLDLGRAPFGMPLLKRTIRIMGQLKLNTLHLHLYDDQLCGFHFANLPLGHENPFSLNADDLKEIVRYARSYHISVMPELESWGHVASIVYHYPELSGGEGMYAGASFGVGQKTYDLLEKMYDEIVPCLEDNASVHVGLDEAHWSVLPGEENKGCTPASMVGQIYEILMRVGNKYHKKITMHLWADHGGRPLPKDIEDKVVIEPWKYLATDQAAILTTLEKYGGTGKTPCMMGAGANSYAYAGNYEATRIWCQGGVKYPNILGVTLCLWESNDLGGRLITLYGGSDFAWNPQPPIPFKKDPLGELLRQHLDRQMRDWQLIFPDALPAAINADRGPEVKTGHYAWPPLAGKSVAPTVDFRAPSTK